MRRRCGGWCGGRLTPGSTSWCPAGPPARARRSSRGEHLRVVEITLEEAKGKVPVVAGAGGYNTAEVIDLAKELEAMGVDGILSVTPYYNKPTQEGLYQHYKAIASAIPLAHHCLQRAGPHGSERRAGYADAAGRNRQHRRREGSLGQHRADCRHPEPGAGTLRGSLRRRRRHPPLDRAGRQGRDLHRGERDPGGDDRDRSPVSGRTTSPRPGEFIESTCR